MDTQRKFDFSRHDLYNRAFLPLFQNDAEFLHIYGGAGSGKSRFIAQREIVKSFAPERKGRRTLIIRRAYNTLKDSCYSELETVINEWGLQQHFEFYKYPLGISNVTTGTDFLFRGLDDAERLKSVTLTDRCWIEEATELDDKSDLEQIRLRLRGFSNVQLILSYNPINRFHWINAEYHEKHDPRHHLHKTTYRDNEKLLALDPSYGAYIESTKVTNPLYYQVYGLGEWGAEVEGLIYPDYVLADEMPADEQPHYGLDFGFNDPTALVEIRVKDNEPKKELYVREVIYERHLTADQLIARMNALGVSPYHSIIADNARPEMIDALRSAGFNAQSCTKGKGSILDGINKVREYTLRPVRGSRNLLAELQTYSWLKGNGQYRDAEPKDATNHSLDALRYAVSDGLNRGFPVWI